MIQERLSEMGESKSWLARQIGVAPAQITRIFSGRHHSMTLRNIARVAAVLKIRMDDLINWSKVWEGYEEE